MRTKLGADKLYSAYVCALRTISCVFISGNRDDYLLHCIIKTDHDAVISYSKTIAAWRAALLFMEVSKTAQSSGGLRPV